MGLFRKKSPAEKKLKELTGGFRLSDEYLKLLKSHNIDLKDGISIQRQLKNEIKDGSVDENNLESRFNQLIYEYSGENNDDSMPVMKSEKKCSLCGEIQDSDNVFCIKCGNEFKSGETIRCFNCGKEISKSAKKCPYCGENTDSYKICPNCRKSFKKDVLYCDDCGYEFISNKLPKFTKKCPNCDTTQKAINEVCCNCEYDLKDVDYDECSDLVNCPYCSRKIPNYIDICPFCEKIINKEDICPNCSMKRENLDKFCNGCGYDFTSSEMPKYLKKCPECDLLQSADNKACCSCKSDLSGIDYEKCDDLDVCEHCGREKPKDLEVCPFCQKSVLTLNVFIRKFKFLSTQEHNLQICPKCNTKLLKDDLYCFSCGEVLSKKTVKKQEVVQEDDELSGLEALYNQTVSSKYEPSFKVAYVLFLNSFNRDQKFHDKLAKRHGTTYNKLKKQAMDDCFVEIAPPISVAKDYKVSELKEILKENNLKVSGKKDELIERLDENLSEDILKKYFKSKNYQVSAKGSEFLVNNNYITYIYKNNDISNAFYPTEILQLFDEREYMEDEIHEILANYLKKRFNEKLNRELWVDFKIYANSLAYVLEDKGDFKDALNLRFQVFLFDINNYSVVLQKPDPRKTKLKKKDLLKLTQLLHSLSLPIDELKELFEISYNEVLFETVITKQDSLIYLLKVFGGEDLVSISKEINEVYSKPY